jgi:hypothetical protein
VLKSLRDSSLLEGHGVSRDVSSLRDSPLNLSLRGTPVPDYRLCRPYGTILLRPVNGTAIARLLHSPSFSRVDAPTEQSRRDGIACSPARECRARRDGTSRLMPCPSRTELSRRS